MNENFTTAAGISATAIMIANVVVWFFGGNWTPQAKAGVGSLSATIVFVLGIVLFPQAWPDGPTAFTTLFLAVLTVLSSAGAPVFRDVMRIGMQVSAKSGKRRWTGWNN